MKKRFFALGLMLAMSASGTAWARQPIATTPVTGRFTSVDSTAKRFTIETPTGKMTFKTTGRTVFMQRDTRVNLSDLTVGDRIRVAYTGQGLNRIAAHVDAFDTGTPGGNTVTGRVTSVDVSGRRVTIDMANGSTDFASINTGDQVRLQLASDLQTANRIDVLSGEARDARTMGAYRPPSPKTGGSRRLLGVGLLAMTGAAVVLRSRRPRTI